MCVYGYHELHILPTVPTEGGREGGGRGGSLALGRWMDGYSSVQLRFLSSVHLHRRESSLARVPETAVVETEGKEVVAVLPLVTHLYTLFAGIEVRIRSAQHGRH